MDKYRENVKKVQKALNQDAAFIQPNPYLAQRVLNAANGKGGTRVRKKFSFSLVLVLVLLLLAVTAVAEVLLSMRQIVDEHAVPMANEYSGESYTIEDTNLLLQLAKENGIVFSEEGYDCSFCRRNQRLQSRFLDQREQQRCPQASLHISR